jgi:phage terminase small subunit
MIADNQYKYGHARGRLEGADAVCEEVANMRYQPKCLHHLDQLALDQSTCAEATAGLTETHVERLLRSQGSSGN